MKPVLIPLTLFKPNQRPSVTEFPLTDMELAYAWESLEDLGEPRLTVELQTLNGVLWSVCVEWVDADGEEHGDISCILIREPSPSDEKIAGAIELAIRGANGWVCQRLKEEKDAE